MKAMQSMCLLALLYVGGALAATTTDPSGHWQGLVQIPGQDIEFEVDLVKDEAGHVTGTMAVPSESVRGLRVKVSLSGSTIHFEARSDQPFSGEISQDGKSIEGDYSIEGHTLPMSMMRTGDAHLVEAPRNPAIGKEFEGRWTGTLGASGGAMRLLLTMANRPDGSVRDSV